MADSVTMSHPQYPDAGTITIPEDRVASKEAHGWVVESPKKKVSSLKKDEPSSASADNFAEER